MFRDLRTKIIDILSVLLVGAGVVLWALPIQALSAQAGRVLQANVILSSLVFIFLATQLTTVGVAFYAYSLTTRKVRQEEEEVESTLDRLEVLLGEQRKTAPGSTPTIRVDFDRLRNPPQGKPSKIHLLAVVEGILVLLLYGWLVAEFQSNLYMQKWVSANISWATYLLNDYALILIIGLLVGGSVSQLKRRQTRRANTISQS